MHYTAVYAQSIDALAPGDMGSDDWDEMKWSMNELGILPGGKLGKLIMENMYDENPTLPTEFIGDKEFDLCISLFNVINHVIKIEKLKTFFEKVVQNLNKGGVFVFDCFNSVVVIKSRPLV